MRDLQNESVDLTFSEVVHVPKVSFESVDYSLPPSKSHLIRLLALASLNDGNTELIFHDAIGLDVYSMIDALRCLGIKIIESKNDSSSKLSVVGVGNNGFTYPQKPIYCGNSGTALRILMGLVASMNEKVSISGDESLSIRENDSIINSLIDSGISVEKIEQSNLPIVISGPWHESAINKRPISLDCSKSSQPLSSWMIASALLPCPVKIKLVGETVSNKHYQLTQRLCNDFGGDIKRIDDYFEIGMWQPKLPDTYIVPGDSSMASFAMLLCKLHKCQIKLSNWPKHRDVLGNEILQREAQKLGINWNSGVLSCIDESSFSMYDLTDCNDLITPLSALIAISGGGEIIGISHTVYKESNRLEKTIELLEHFGLELAFTGSSLVIEGGQTPKTPNQLINSYNDHRIFMTAVILMTKFGGSILGKGLHTIADVNFLVRLGLE